jgi:hypothetical protein
LNIALQHACKGAFNGIGKMIEEFFNEAIQGYDYRADIGE